MIYLDNAATTVMSPVALQAFLEVSQNNYGNPSSVYSYGRKAKEILEEARKTIARCIGALPEEVYFTSCGTESDNWAINLAIKSGIKKIVTTQIEHHAILHPIQQYEDLGIPTFYISVDSRGLVNQDILAEKLDSNQTFVSVMLLNNEVGSIQHIQDISRLVHDSNKKSIFHTDAVQAVGHIPIDVNQLGIDLLSASAHKFNGPKGVGFLYIRKNCKATPFILGGGQESGIRSGTENVGGIYAMAKALEENVANMEVNRTHVKLLEEKLCKGLLTEEISYGINADSNQRAAGILNLAIKGIDGEGLMNMLDLHNICISVGSACNSKSQSRSHVLKALGLSDERIDSSVRISIGKYNEENDIKELVKCIKNYCKVTALAGV